ncbi:MAG: EamA family transporter [Anaerolineae bacterium]|nr:EamA family transporter [Anaerolineae bacterium]
MTVGSNGRGYLLVLSAAAAWSTSGLFIRWTVASGGLSALSLAFWRDLTTAASLILGLALFRREWLRVRRRDLPWLAGLGIAGVGAFHVLWNLTILHIGYAAATVILYSAPVFVTVMAWLIWREPLTWSKIAAIAMTLAGCVLAAGLEKLAGTDLTAGGLILGLGAALTYGSFSLFSRRLTGHYSPWTILTYGFAFGTLILLPLQFGIEQPWKAPPETWLWFAGLVYVATIAPFAAYLTGLTHLPVSVASILAASEVVFAALIGYVVFGERLRGWQPVGAALVVGGVILLATRANRQTVDSAVSG